MYFLLKESSAHRLALAAEQRAQQGELAAQEAEKRAKAELWNSYLARPVHRVLSGEPGRRFEGTGRDHEGGGHPVCARTAGRKAIACLALPDIKLKRRIEVHRGVFDGTLERYAMVSTNLDDIRIRRTRDDKELLSTAEYRRHRQVALVALATGGKLLPVGCLDHCLRVWDLNRRALIIDRSLRSDL